MSEIGEIAGVKVFVSPEHFEEIKKKKIIEENEILNELQERINKAIEYMEEAINSDSFTELPSGKITDIPYCIVAFEDLLEILKGK